MAEKVNRTRKSHLSNIRVHRIDDAKTECSKDDLSLDAHLGYRDQTGRSRPHRETTPPNQMCFGFSLQKYRLQAPQRIPAYEHFHAGELPYFCNWHDDNPLHRKLVDMRLSSAAIPRAEITASRLAASRMNYSKSTVYAARSGTRPSNGSRSSMAASQPKRSRRARP